MKKLITAVAVASVIGSGSLVLAENAAERGANAVGNTARDAGNAAGNAAQNTGNAMKDTVAPNPADAGKYPADNSGKNARDASDSTVTADDQSNSKADVEITAAIRRAVTDDDSLSVNAQNVKIITNGGVVTLRGPVKSEQERASIAQKAKQVSGVTRVNNELEVAAQ
jgi:hypothetical protein